MDLNSPYFLLLVGLATVFVVLILIIEFGKLLIWCVNRFFPEEVKQVKTAQPNAGNVDINVRQAIEIAIAKVSNGKKSIQSIEKI